MVDFERDDSINWHLEGIASENIIATGIYYYDFDNIIEGELRFRAALSYDDLDYPQHNHQYVQTHFGLKQGSESDHVGSTVDLGSITPTEGTLLMFPNCLPHSLRETRLMDPTRPGHRRILVFFFIDSENPVISTGDIGPNPLSLETREQIREILMFQRSKDMDILGKILSKEIGLCEH